MTNPTTNPDLIIAIKKLDKHVPWYEWCELYPGTITGTLLAEYAEDTEPRQENREVLCPPACEAAVVMYVGDLWQFWFDLHKEKTVVSCEVRWSHEKGKWCYLLRGAGGYERGYYDTQPEAAAALIIAIAASLEE